MFYDVSSSRKHPPHPLSTPLVLAATLALSYPMSACSSGYTPRQTGRIAIVMQDGNQAYARDGRVHQHGLLGGGLVDAVHGVPQAEEAARTYRRRVGWGLVSMVGGAVCSSVALAFTIDQDSGESSDLAAATSIACLGLMGLGAGLAISGVTYQHDAVNIFNDSVTPVGPVALPGQAPRLASPGAPGAQP